MKKTISTSILILILLVIGTSVAILYARGYRIWPEKNGKTKLEGTGLLVVTSKPDGAKVLINDRLITATDNTINLLPNSYHVKILKDGYFSWEKTIIIEKEIVARADALLFPIAPKLESVTSTGAEHPTIDPSGTIIAYTVASNSAEKNGIYLLDMNSQTFFAIGRSARQIADQRQDLMSQSSLEFSPDGTELVASISALPNPRTYLLSTNSFNKTPQLLSAFARTQLNKQWKDQEKLKQDDFLGSIPKKLIPLITEYFDKPSLSPDKDKILYTASKSGELSFIITPRRIGTNSTPEERQIIENNLYVYDIKEDRNYLIFDRRHEKGKVPPHFVWHPNSEHLIFIQDRKIRIMEYDSMNNTLIYSGPFLDDFVFPWPDGSNLLILTNLNNPETPYNLYRISLR